MTVIGGQSLWRAMASVSRWGSAREIAPRVVIGQGGEQRLRVGLAAAQRQAADLAAAQIDLGPHEAVAPVAIHRPVVPEEREPPGGRGAPDEDDLGGGQLVRGELPVLPMARPGRA